MHIPHKSRPSAAAFLLLAVWCVIPVRVVFAQPLTTRPAPTVYRHAAVAADHAVASQAGLEILKAGGNAVDAAVAASFCLSVVRPYSCGIGGGGFMLIWKPARERAAPVMVAVNYRERAAAVVGRDYYVRLADRTASRTGHRAVGVPGTVAGLLWAHEHYGSLERAVVMGPAIRAAEQGFRADTNHVAAARRLQERFERSGGAPQYAGPIWTDLCLDGRVAPGDFISNPDQARALKLIARDGADAFYRGEIAEAIVAT
ncbi:MAG: gamma-glutamyltransferase, partial [Planctomycetes bacterium]|nr:gamma-glutamyltransferase [Planctomycetota bacterium]